MKKILLILLSFTMLLSITSCGTDENESASQIENIIEQDGLNTAKTDYIVLNQLGTEEIVIDKPGIYQADETGEFNGNIIIKCSDVTLRDTVIVGDLTLHEDIGDGDALMENVRVEGINYVNGCGANSSLYHSCYISFIRIKKDTGKVRVLAEENTTIEEVVATTSSIIEVGDDSSNIGNLKVDTDNPDSEIDIRGNISNVEVKNQSNINIESNSNIDNLAIDETAGGTKVSGEGNIDILIVDADDVNVETNVEDMYSNNDNTEFTYYNEKVRPPHYNQYTNDDNADDNQTNNDDPNNNENQASIPNDKNQEGNNQEKSNQPNDENSQSSYNEENENPESGNELLPVEFQFINEGYEYSDSDRTYKLILCMTEPCTVYYVFEDISVMMGNAYAPSNAQVKNGNNCFGQPNPKPFPLGPEDDAGNATEQEFPPEALISGKINVTEANKDYAVTINDPGSEFPLVLHIVAVNSKGEEIRN